jgi:glycosyltransferase involved in cell wall biosynthesis
VTQAPSKTLIAITTFNHCEVTRLCLETLTGIPQDVKVFDDCSTDGTRTVCQEYEVQFVSNTRPQGLTSLWNLAFSEFVDSGYQNLVITNNDVLFPEGAVDQLEHDLELHPYLGILTRKDDSPMAGHHAVEHVTGLSKDEVNQPNKLQEVQEQLVMLDLPPVSIEWVYGFCFGLSRKVLPYAYSHNALVDPRLINTGQEDYLSRRIPSKMLCRRVFAYHFKGVTCGPMPTSWSKDSRDDLHCYHQTRVSLRLRMRFLRNKWVQHLRYHLRKIRQKLKRALHSLS